MHLISVEHMPEFFIYPSFIIVTISANRKAVIFEVLNHFFEKLALGDVSDAAKLFEDISGTEVFTPQEKDDYNR